MHAGDLCRSPVTVSPDTDLVAAAALMRDRHTSHLVVVEPEPGPDGSGLRPVGVLTARDLATGVVACAADPRQLTVADVMVRHPATIDLAEPLERALRAMRQLQVRQMPVVGPRDTLYGVLALDDVIDVLTGEAGAGRPGQPASWQPPPRTRHPSHLPAR